MTSKELAKYIDQPAFFVAGDLRFPVTILDAREKFGRVDLLIRPVGGTGSEWRSLKDSIVLAK